ncbi:Aste57867_19630 [Aphanomyces stellatus]|uniref:Aste57867_19630 protein n=1 Tax=Aphanomyces stellatus TaxID=120398 RepID=A0A485LD68_9STRA|nr:hypothetical protein As57867_019565 [Aphanomyces stellatus]VFT96330.1 Aste57867_19630 [Aphanomyces stellatus]
MFADYNRLNTFTCQSIFPLVHHTVPMIKCVARVPVDLLTIQPPEPEPVPIDVSGHLMLRDNTYTAFQSLFFQLTNTELRYSFEGNLRGIIRLSDILIVQPHASPTVAWGIELVTRNHTWVIAAHNEEDCGRWVDAICHQVPFEAVGVMYKRMLQLAGADRPNEVRLVLLPSYTVAEAVARILECYACKLDAIVLHPYDPTDYVLQVTDMTTIVLDDMEALLGSYDHIQFCLANKAVLRLTIVHPDDERRRG